MSDERELKVEVMLIVDVDEMGERGAELTHSALESACAAAAEAFLRTKSGVRYWAASQWFGPVPADD